MSSLAAMPRVSSAQAATIQAAGARWKLSPDPVLSIGEDGTPQGEFLRIDGVTRTALGQIVIANAGSNEIRIFSSTGKFVKTLGRQGAGPGEFQNMQWVGKAGDSLFLHDSRSMRISTFTVHDGFLNSKLLPSIVPDARIYPIARFNNGDLLVQPIRATSLNHADGVYRDSIRAGVLLNTPADSVVWIGTFPFLSYFAYNPTNAERAQSVGTYRFGPQAHWAVWGNLIWIGDGGSNEITLFDKTGKTVSKVRTPWPERPYDKVAFERVAKGALADVPEAQRKGYVGAMMQPKYLPRAEPTFRKFLVSPEGYLWIERYHLDPATPGECVVMNRSGAIVAQLTMPSGFEPKEIGTDYVLGIKRNSDGVETVAMYRIWK